MIRNRLGNAPKTKFHEAGGNQAMTKFEIHIYLDLYYRVTVLAKLCLLRFSKRFSYYYYRGMQRIARIKTFGFFDLQHYEIRVGYSEKWTNLYNTQACPK